MVRKSMRIPAILLIVQSVIAFVFWVIVLLYALLFGGSPGLSNERMVPLSYVGIMAFGLLGANLALAAGIIGLFEKSPRKILPLCAFLFDIIASLPFFLMDLAVAGLFVLIIAIFPPLLYLFLMWIVKLIIKRRERKAEAQ